MDKAHPTYSNDTMMLVLYANVDKEAFQNFLDNPPEAAEEDREIAETHFNHIPPSFQPALAKAYREKTYTIWPETFDGVNVRPSFTGLFYYTGDIVGYWVTCNGEINSSDSFAVTEIDRELRREAMQALDFLKENIPGFKDAYLMLMPPYLGFRGGPRIVGEYNLTVEEMFAETRFDDVIFRNIHEMNHDGPESGYDVPLRMTIPKGIDGMLVCGLGAAFERRGHDPSGMRARPSMMALGQAVGTAASIAAKEDVATVDIPIGKLHERLKETGIDFGEN
jgi:hypothetical protein